jgi:hypothetical protein
MTITHNVRDTGERKTLFGLQARHLIITNEMEASADSCNGPSRMKMEYDGWYVDFAADFSCPIAGGDHQPSYNPAKPDCIDRIITKGNYAAVRTGQMIEGTMKMYGADGKVTMTQTTETLELTRSPLEASLFDIPAGYSLASSIQDLYAVSMSDISAAARNNSGDRTPERSSVSPSARSVAVNISIASGVNADQGEIDQYVRSRIAQRGLRTVNGSADYTLNVQVRRAKESTAGKIGGLFGKVTVVPTKAGSVDVDLSASVSGRATGQANVKNKFEGPPGDAIRKAIDQAIDQLFIQID